MTPCSESPREATRSTPLLHPRHFTKIATWNVRTMYEAGKAAQVATEMRTYNLALLGLCETRWTQAGQVRLSTGELILYSGHDEDTPHTEGVALMLGREAQSSLISWEAVSSRLIMAKFQTKTDKIDLNIVQCYAPTNDTDVDTKEHFYCQLQTVVDKMKEKDINILMGDLNAKVGDNNNGYEQSMGRHGLGKMNENGELFADFSAFNNLVIGGSIFPHRDIHKATWVSPDHRTENQIDHICISQKFRRSLQDVRVKRGADVASDHHLVVAKLKLRLKKTQTQKNPRIHFNTDYLKDKENAAIYKVAVSNRYQVLQDKSDNTDLEQLWEETKHVWTDACEETLGRKTTSNKPWITSSTLEKMQIRKDKKAKINSSRTRYAKAEAQKLYSEAHKAVRRSIRADKRSYIDSLAREAEEAAGQRNMKALYDTTRKLSGKFRKPDRPIKNKEGQRLTTVAEQLNRWKEHFSELLNRQPPENPPEILPAENLLPINCEKPSKAEIKRAINKLKNGKAAGPDNVPAEALKADPSTSAVLLYNLFEKIWDEEKIPTEWKEGLIVKLPKKGDLQECKNYRGIMLLSVPGKVLNRILLDRMKSVVDAKLRDHQAGFRQDRSCTDHIATLRIIIEQTLEWNSSLYVNFIDYEKAFDSLDRNILWKLLSHYGIPPKFVSLIKHMYEGTVCRVVHGGQQSDSFEVKTGVRQGCLLSPFLFILAIDWIMKTTTAGKRNGIQWTPWRHLEDLDFADDIALLSHSHAQMQSKTESLAATSSSIGLNINKTKSKVLRIGTTSGIPVSLTNEVLEEVSSFTYLGSIVDTRGGTDEDVKVRIGKARTAFQILKNIWESKEIHNSTKIRIFNTNVKAVLFYGSETWKTSKTTLDKLQTFLNRCLRKIFKLKWWDKMKNEDLWKMSNQLPIELQIRRRKWGWIGHTLRKPMNNITRQALTWNPQGGRRPGRPRNSWRRSTLAEARRGGYDWKELEKAAPGRVRWRSIVDGLCSEWG